MSLPSARSVVEKRDKVLPGPISGLVMSGEVKTKVALVAWLHHSTHRGTEQSRQGLKAPSASFRRGCCALK